MVLTVILDGQFPSAPVHRARTKHLCHLCHHLAQVHGVKQLRPKSTFSVSSTETSRLLSMQTPLYLTPADNVHANQAFFIFHYCFWKGLLNQSPRVPTLKFDHDAKFT